MAPSFGRSSVSASARVLSSLEERRLRSCKGSLRSRARLQKRSWPCGRGAPPKKGVVPPPCGDRDVRRDFDGAGSRRHPRRSTTEEHARSTRLEARKRMRVVKRARLDVHVGNRDGRRNQTKRGYEASNWCWWHLSIVRIWGRSDAPPCAVGRGSVLAMRLLPLVDARGGLASSQRGARRPRCGVAAARGLHNRRESVGERDDGRRSG